MAAGSRHALKQSQRLCKELGDFKCTSNLLRLMTMIWCSVLAEPGAAGWAWEDRQQPVGRVRSQWHALGDWPRLQQPSSRWPGQVAWQQLVGRVSHRSKAVTTLPAQTKSLPSCHKHTTALPTEWWKEIVWRVVLIFSPRDHCRAGTAPLLPEYIEIGPLCSRQ